MPEVPNWEASGLRPLQPPMPVRQEERLGHSVVDLVPLLEDAVDDGRVGDPLEKILDHDVLVVLAQHPPGLGEGAALVDQAVVGLEEGQVQLGDDQVLVVAGGRRCGPPGRG